MGLRIRNRSVINIRNISSFEELKLSEGKTHQYRRVVGWFRLSLRLCRLFVELDVLHITATEDNVLEFLGGGRYEFVDLSVFGAKGKHIFQRNCRLLWIDLVKGSDISDNIRIQQYWHL